MAEHGALREKTICSFCTFRAAKQKYSKSRLSLCSVIKCLILQHLDILRIWRENVRITKVIDPSCFFNHKDHHLIFHS